MQPTVTITWSASEPDGPHGLPHENRYKRLSEGNDGPLIQTFLARPESLSGFQGPKFLDWNVLPGNSTAVTLTGLIPNDAHLLVVTAIDRHGLFNPVFSLSKNMLRMFVIPTGQPDAGSTSPGQSAGTQRPGADGNRSRQ